MNKQQMDEAIVAFRDQKLETMEITTVTKVALKGGKKNPHLGRIYKMSAKMQVKPFGPSEAANYEDEVNKRLAKEGKEANFKSGKLPWGELVEGTPYISHKGETYLRVIAESKPARTAFYEKLDDGTYALIDIDTVQGYDVPAEKKETTPDPQGGLENQVIVRSINIENIVGIEAGKHQNYCAWQV